jgi:hypothetical protein
VTPTTDRITVLRYGESATLSEVDGQIEALKAEIAAPGVGPGRLS